MRLEAIRYAHSGMPERNLRSLSGIPLIYLYLCAVKDLPMDTYRFILWTLLSVSLSVCGSRAGAATGGGHAKKVKAIWVDANSNRARFETPADVAAYVKRIDRCGFNTIYLDVKPGTGYAFFKSTVLPKAQRNVKGGPEPTWDYVDTWLKAARRYGIDVYATMMTLCFGNTNQRRGVVYEDPRWDGKTQVMMRGNRPDSLVDIRDVTEVDAAMLNPTLPEVQDFVVSYIRELVQNYPGLKGICLDYCRWWDGNYGMGDSTLNRFGHYIGQPVTNRNDIITAEGGMGPLYARWIEFRARAVTQLIGRVRQAVKAVNPQLQLHLWSGTDWEIRYAYGQNWASPQYVPQGPMFTPTYSQTSFAPLIDALIIGAYSEYAWTEEYPGTKWWAVEACMNRYPDYVKGACPVIGSIQAYTDYAMKKGRGLTDACALCLEGSEGLMVFELGHIAERNEWQQIREGMRKNALKKH